MPTTDSSGWPAQTFATFKSMQIRQVGTVPDAGHSRLIALCEADPDMRLVTLTTEEEGIGLATGAWFGGQRSALLIQSSGVGNCINMLSLVLEYRVPLLMLVTLRGDWGEFNPMQVHMGRAVATILQDSGVLVETVDQAADVAPTVNAMGTMAFNTSRAVAVLLRQRIIGAKNFKESTE